MHDAGRMSSTERCRHLDSQRERFLRRERSLLERIAQRVALEVLLDDVVDRLAVSTHLGTDIVYDRDVRVVQRCGGARLLFEARQPFRIGGEFGG